MSLTMVLYYCLIEASLINWTQQSRFHLVTREEPSLETLWLKDIRMMDKVQITECSSALIYQFVQKQNYCSYFKILTSLDSFEVLMAVRMMTFYWALVLCRISGRCQCFRETYCLHLQGWIWRQYVPLKCWHLPAILHGAKAQKIVIIIVRFHSLLYDLFHVSL
jgi:hypothetical protein